MADSLPRVGQLRWKLEVNSRVYSLVNILTEKFSFKVFFFFFLWNNKLFKEDDDGVGWKTNKCQEYSIVVELKLKKEHVN